MSNSAIKIEDAVDKLLGVLDEDVRHIRKSLSRLDDLRHSVIKRDDASLHQLLEDAQSESGSYKNRAARRRLLREELAVALGCAPGQMTLSRLEAELSGARKAQVSERKMTLQTLIDRLRTEHTGTMMLLSDCARFNGMLLKSVLQLGQTGGITYSPRGSVQRQINTAFVDSQF
ncbi:MAG: hypothetical protein J7M40_02555 [Planctomycetes bacterium]|nr:hypothetical protein [Planctomycetota bacterium]